MPITHLLPPGLAATRAAAQQKAAAGGDAASGTVSNVAAKRARRAAEAAGTTAAVTAAARAAAAPVTRTPSAVTGDAPVLAVPLSEELSGSLRLMKPLASTMVVLDAMHSMTASGLLPPKARRKVVRGGKYRKSTQPKKVRMVEFPRKGWVPPSAEEATGISTHLRK
jgi:hypothetical protein